MPGPIEPDWGVPQAFLTLSNAATWNSTTGALVDGAGVSRWPRLTRNGQLQWSLLSDAEATAAGHNPPRLPIRDSTTSNILINGTYDTAKKTVKYLGVTYNLAMKWVPTASENVAFTVVV